MIDFRAVFRILFFSVLIISALIVRPAQAYSVVDRVPVQTVYFYTVSETAALEAPTAAASCQSWAYGYGVNNVGTLTARTGAISQTCVVSGSTSQTNTTIQKIYCPTATPAYSITYNGTGSSQTVECTRLLTSCPSGTTYNSTANTCDVDVVAPLTCTAPQVLNAAGTACEAQCANAPNLFGNFVGFGSYNSSICVGGCAYPTTNGVSYTDKTTGTSYTQTSLNNAVSTKQACVGSDSTAIAVPPTVAGTPTPASCSMQGDGFITNGTKTVCVKMNTATSLAGAQKKSASIPSTTATPPPFVAPVNPEIDCSVTPASCDIGQPVDPENQTTSPASSVPAATSSVPPTDLCTVIPDSPSCHALGDVPVAETIATSSPTFDIGAVSFSSAASCPAPITFHMNVGFINRDYYISWQPMCDVAQLLRPIFLAIGAIAAAFIFAAGIMI
jgi:hypothetical protein